MTPILPSDVDASAPSRVSEKAVEAAAEAQFTEWFVKHYPGPDTIIHKPTWHAPKIFLAAKHALRALQPHPNAGQAVAVEGLKWSEVSKPNGVDCFYDHTKAQSPVGEYSIEWKSWKDYDDYTVFLHPADSEVVGSGGWGEGALDRAKSAAQSDFDTRIRSALSPIPAAPVQSEVVKRTPQRDHIAAVMLQKGSPEQQAEALAYVHGKLSITSPQPVEPAPGAGECETCNGTGMEGRGLICRDCDEPKAIERLTQHEIDAGYTGRMTHSSTYLSAEQQARLGGASPGAGEDAEREAGLSARAVDHLQIAAIRLRQSGRWQDAQLATELEALSRTRQPTEPKPAQGMGDALEEFARWAIKEGVFEGGDLDGWAIEEKAAELGLITETSYDPEEHGPSDCAEPGCQWFVFSPALTEQKG